jgi:hypothetical protein
VNLLSRFPRLTTCIVFVVATITTIAMMATTHPDGLAAAIDDVRCCGTWKEKLNACQERDTILQSNLVMIRDRTVQKEHLIREWLQERIDFRTAVEQFQQLNGDSEVLLAVMRNQHGGKLTIDELSALNFVQHFHSHVHNMPSADQYRKRTRRQLIQMFPRLENQDEVR